MSVEIESPGSRRPSWELWGVVVLFGLFLFPAVKTGYYAEDLIHSMTPGIARLDRLSIPGQLVQAVRFNLAIGRFYPVTQLLHVGVHGLARDVLVYKSVLVAGTVFDMILFFLMVRRLTGSPGFASLASCLTVGLFQFRNHPDPVLGYYLQMQLVAGGLFFSLYAMLLYLEGRGRAWLAASAAAYLLIAMTYEITYPFFAAHLLLIWRGGKGWTGRLVAALPIVGVVLACGAVTYVVRRHSVNQDYYVHRVDFNVVAYLRAIWHQVSAALPMSYLLGDPHSMFRGLHGFPGYVRWALHPMPVLVALSAMGLGYSALRKSGNGEEGRPGWSPWAVGLGSLLVVLPTVLIAMSPFHQVQFRFGVGWVPVLIESYGMGLVISTGLWGLISLRPMGGAFAPWKCAGAAALVAAVTGLTYRANVEVATCLNAPVGSPHYRAQSALHGGFSDQNRRLLESALVSGLMDQVPERSVVHLANAYAIWQMPLESVYFYATYASKVLVTEVPGAEDPTSLCHSIFMQFLNSHSVTPVPGRPYWLRDVCLGKRSGYVVLGQEGEGGETRLFVRHPRLYQDLSSPAFRVEVASKAGPGRSGASMFTRTGKDLKLLRAGHDWGLYAIQPGTGSTGPDALRVVFDVRDGSVR